MQHTRRPRRISSKPLAACLAMALAGAATASMMPDRSSHRALRVPAPRAGRIGGDAHPVDHTASAPRFDRWRSARHSSPAVPQGSIAVTNCADSGTGSLRDAVASADEGQTIDMTDLSCAAITLTTGSIVITQDSLTLQGPTADTLALSGENGSTRVTPIVHVGTGTLTINDLSVTGGAKYFDDSQVDDARGGCIFSSGSIALSSVGVAYCTVQNTSSAHGSLGGAVYAAYDLSISHASIFSNGAIAANGQGRGGGLFAGGRVTIADSYIARNSASDRAGGVEAHGGVVVKYSQISDNYALDVGGLYSNGTATIGNSTISNNGAFSIGGAFLEDDSSTSSVTVVNSTISGNAASAFGDAGLVLYANTARVANTTIAFNAGQYAFSPTGAGLYVPAGSLDLESTIIAGNTHDDGSGPVADDFYDRNSASLTGANNLIVAASSVPPPGTISADPELLPLSDNGGATATHALRATSPAVDAGNNDEASAFDQRGTGFARVLGLQADIGAFEFDPTDVIFQDGFD